MTPDDLRALARRLVAQIPGTFAERDAEAARLVREAILEEAHEAGGERADIAARLGVTEVKLSQLRMAHPGVAARFPFKLGRPFAKKGTPEPK